MEKQIRGKRFRQLLTAGEIEAGVRQLARRLESDFAGREPHFVSVLNGAFVFTADLLRMLKAEVRVEFVKLQSYEGMASAGRVNHLIGLSPAYIEGRDVVILEDIVDTGKTLAGLIPEISRKAASVTLVSLLFKPSALLCEAARPAYTAFEIENHFVVGYGLDYDGAGRHLEDLWVAV